MEFSIGRRIVGDGHPTFIVAEMSANHGHSLEQAIEVIRAAHRAGADAIKLQTYTADTITLKSSKEDFLINKDSPWAEHKTLWDLYNQAYTPWEWHGQLFEEASSLGLEIFSSPFDHSAVDFLQQFDPPAYKIASPEITDIPLIEKVASTGKPVIISTGLANLDDIELAVNTLRDNGVNDIVLLKCTTAYPAPPDEANLLTIPDIKQRFNVLSGLSDHTLGSAVPIASVVLGASLVEKHFRLNDMDETVDSFFSMSEADFHQMTLDLRTVEQAVGKVSYEVTASAQKSLKGRRSLYISQAIEAGEVFTPENIRSVRPASGLSPKYYHEVIGRRATRDLKAGDQLSWDVIDEKK